MRVEGVIGVGGNTEGKLFVTVGVEVIPETVGATVGDGGEVEVGVELEVDIGVGVEKYTGEVATGVVSMGVRVNVGGIRDVGDGVEVINVMVGIGVETS